jgi:hypothetical protein
MATRRGRFRAIGLCAISVWLNIVWPINGNHFAHGFVPVRQSATWSAPDESALYLYYRRNAVISSARISNQTGPERVGYFAMTALTSWIWHATSSNSELFWLERTVNGKRWRLAVEFAPGNTRNL